MKKLILGIFGVLLVVGVAYAAVELLDQNKHYSWRYKMTVTVETPEGIKTGSAVREVDVKLLYRFNPGASSQYVVRRSVIGEAVVVDLGQRRKLFAIMDPDGAYQVIYKMFPPSIKYSDDIEPVEADCKYYSHLRDAKASLPSARIPEFARLVTFTDLNDPMSVTDVDYRDLTKTFGEGVSIKEVTVEMTDEPITWGIEKLLPWLNDYYNNRLDGNRFGTAMATNQFANSLSSGAFSTKENNYEH